MAAFARCDVAAPARPNHVSVGRAAITPDLREEHGMYIKQRTILGVHQLGSLMALGFVFSAGLAHADTLTPPPVPAGLQVPAGNEVVFVGHAVGTQNYVCVPAASVGQVAWMLFTPQATLFTKDGEQVSTHYSSPNPAEPNTVRPTWQDSRDTSAVWGSAIKSSSDPAFVAQGAIPWLLVQIVGARQGPTGGATIFGTTFIQRLNTTGGVAPATGCAVPTDVGRKAFVPYTADYVFYQ